MPRKTHYASVVQADAEAQLHSESIRFDMWTVHLVRLGTPNFTLQHR